MLMTTPGGKINRAVGSLHTPSPRRHIRAHRRVAAQPRHEIDPFETVAGGAINLYKLTGDEMLESGVAARDTEE